MMILRSSPPSPFGRKVRIALIHLGLADRVEIVATDTSSKSDTIRKQNPLGKIPTLITESGKALYDSRVILDYLDHLTGGGRIVPLDPDERFHALTLQALADGILDASILRVYERRYRSEEQVVDSWLEYQAGKVERALTTLEALPPGAQVDVGTIALACALGYQDLRFAGTWRGIYPRLVGWLDAFAASVPAFEQTRFVE
ncbi:MAG TPA: glutathione S-transferase [Beijerinckiaceae bacterium]|jgi:glutathione S-transferase|nr:glutathione S-transferase [Beijerinckiaceae bacterium]